MVQVVEFQDILIAGHRAFPIYRKSDGVDLRCPECLEDIHFTSHATLEGILSGLAEHQCNGE